MGGGWQPIISRDLAKSLSGDCHKPKTMQCNDGIIYEWPLIQNIFFHALDPPLMDHPCMKRVSPRWIILSYSCQNSQTNPQVQVPGLCSSLPQVERLGALLCRGAPSLQRNSSAFLHTDRAPSPPTPTQGHHNQHQREAPLEKALILALEYIFGSSTQV